MRLTSGDSYTQTDFDPTSTPPQPGNPLGNPPYPVSVSASPHLLGFDESSSAL